MKKLAGILILLVTLCIASAALAVSSGTTEHMTWVLDKYGTLTIAGKGTMDRDFWAEEESIKKVVIRQGITSVSDYAFYHCTDLTTVILPDSIKEIGDCAFYFCRELREVVIPDGMEKIGSYAFADCTSLTTIRIPESVREIGEYAFADCSALMDVKILSPSVTIAPNAFEGTPFFSINATETSDVTPPENQSTGSNTMKGLK